MIDHNTMITLEVSYVCPNNVRGSRIRIRSLATNQRRFIGYDSQQYCNVSYQAQTWLEQSGIHAIGRSFDEKSKSYLLLLEWNDEMIAKLTELKLW